MTNSPHKPKLLKVLLLIVVLVAWGCENDEYPAPEGPPVKLSLAVSPATYSGLIAIADDKGYFKDAGLDLSMDLYPSGREALEAVCRGEAQAATVADISFSAKALEEPSIRVLASISTTVGSRIVARKDRNIQSPSDLRGKKVGFSTGTVSDYFLYAFLMTENIPPSDITAVDIPPARQVESVVNGELDAVSAFEVFAFEAEKRLGENAVSWDSQNNLAYHWLLATKASLIRSPEPLKRLFRGLLRAEGFAQTHEEETRTILVRKWNLDPAFVLESWPRTRLSVSLGQSVVTSLENYARWQMVKEGKLEDSTDVLNYLDTGILDEMAPKEVTIFR
ncbi:MAG: ABC transporter substrate-binding protein [Deltaproteobacteria bacterium]|nr:ABC transporter substrate-binding protein [Deltaproteobacteria bacterium]